MSPQRQLRLSIRRLSARTAVIVGMFFGVVLAWLLLAGLPDAWATRAAMLGAARERWERTGPHHYRLMIDRHRTFQRCQLTLDIQDERVLTVTRTSCQVDRICPPEITESSESAAETIAACPSVDAPLTVTDLFRMIDRSLSEQNCGPNGCPCDGVLFLDAEYDPKLGFPMRLRTMNHRRLRDWALVPLQDCTAMGAIREDTSVTLIPLP